VSQRCGVQLSPEHAPSRQVPVHERDETIRVVPFEQMDKLMD